MSFILNHPCSMCKNAIPISGSYGMPRCKAFPDEIPSKFFGGNIDVRQLKECNNGYKYEYDGSPRIE